MTTPAALKPDRLWLTCMLAAISVGAATAGCAETVCPDSRSAITFYYRALDMPGELCADSVTVTPYDVLQNNGYTTTRRKQETWVDPPNSSAVPTATNLITWISGIGAGYISTHSEIGFRPINPDYELDYPGLGGEFAVEGPYIDYDEAEAQWDIYVHNAGQPFDPGDLYVLSVVIGPPFAPMHYIAAAEHGIENHYNTLASNSLLHLETCSGLKVFSYFSSVRDLVSYADVVYQSTGCPDTYTFWRRMGCVEGGGLPSVAHAVSGLELGIHAQATGETTLKCAGCENQAIMYPAVRVEQDRSTAGAKVTFEAFGEGEWSDHRVYGYSTTGDYPERGALLWSTAGSRAEYSYCLHSATVASGYGAYAVESHDSNGRTIRSDALGVGETQGTFSGRIGCWNRLPNNRSGSNAEVIFRRTRGGDVPYVIRDGRLERSAHVESKALVDDCDDCADYVMWTSVLGLDYVSPLYDSLSAQGLDVELWYTLNSDGLSEAREYGLPYVIEANSEWNAGPGGATRQYPVSPGPTLGIVGDVSAGIYYPLPMDTTGMEVSYIVAADLDGDSIPDCPVEVMPIESFEEAQTMAVAAMDVNIGQWVDQQKRVLLVGGDEYGGTVGQYLTEYITETDTLCRVHDMVPYPPLLQSGFSQNGDIADSTRAYVNRGVAEGWLYGRFTLNTYWPANCIPYYGGAEQLTTKQRIVMWVPGCLIGDIGSTEDGVPPPIVEQLAFNDLEGTVLAAAVCNYDAGYEIHHYPWACILRDARLNAPTGTAVSRIHYDAVQAWYDQFPHNHYVLSTYALGSHVIPTDAATSIDLPPREELPGLDLIAVPGVGPEHTFMFSLVTAMTATLRIVDVSGRAITTVRSGKLPAGRQQYTWAGMDRSGERVGAGVYFGILTTEDGQRDVRKVTIIR